MSLLRISNVFNGQPEQSILSIEKHGDEYLFSVSDQASTAAAESSISHLKDIVGEKRLNRLCQKSGIGNQISLILTKSVVRQIFVGLFDVQIEDFDEIEGDQSTKDKYCQLIFSKSLEEVESSLMGLTPTLDQFKIDKAATSGKGFDGLIERIYICLQHHFKIVEETNQKANELSDIEMLTSRLADREMQQGSVIHLSDGFFYVDQVFIGGGAYIALLKDIEKIQVPKLVCRGTAIRPTATGGLESGLNDILVEIGTMGIKHLWPTLSKYLLVHKITAIDVMGKSLGGAHAQALAVLIEGTTGIKVKKLTTYCSVGIGSGVNDIFKQEVLNKRETPFHIQVVRNGGHAEEEIDYIPAVGGVHLGGQTSVEKCDIEVCYIQPGDGEVGVIPKEYDLVTLSRQFLQSFKSPHCRQTTIQKFTWKLITERTQIDEQLSVGNRLEQIRKPVAYIVHYLTLPFLNGDSFASFFHSQKSKIADSLAIQASS